ncbi:MAG: ABC transporter ATP-binding protein [Clostridia bacterium]|nr:ABC transporter ATP-binding protein [Clostridia bacterium]
MLSIKNLTKYYGNTLAVNDLSLDLFEGEIFGFIGPNGAGKSTTIRSVMNLINKTSGSVSFLGQPLDKNALDLKKQIGYLPSDINLYDDMKVADILDYHESFYSGIDTHSKRLNLVGRLALDETKKIEDLSLGNRKKLGIVLALMHSPKLLILDEATSGLDPIMQQEFYNILLEEKKQGTTIFYSTHILSEVSKICDRVGIIKDGTLLKVESVKDMLKKNFVVVTIESKDVASIAKTLKVALDVSKDNLIKFKYEGKATDLIKSLAKYSIDSILIEEASLDDLFLHYYK